MACSSAPPFECQVSQVPRRAVRSNLVPYAYVSGLAPIDARPRFLTTVQPRVHARRSSSTALPAPIPNRKRFLLTCAIGSRSKKGREDRFFGSADVAPAVGSEVALPERSFLSKRSGMAF